MTIDTMTVTTSLLTSQGIFATVEYPGTIHVIRGTSLFVFGTVNPEFGADIYRESGAFQDAGNPDEAIATDISSDCDDPVLIAQTIAQIVAPGIPASFGCAYCHDVLTPGDNVVFTQNSDTSIDVFCSDACRQEAQ